ncbi:hydrogenase nickel incorporation protein HypA [Rhodococcus hoagii]|nr:hydrogenase nickel incorporation protein HypA [Prescottella equi]
MAITQSVVDAVCERADGRTVHSIRLQVGRLCAVVPDAMQFCFRTGPPRVRSRRALGSTSRSRPVWRTAGAATPISPADLILLCPCGSADVEVLSGRELRIMSMEVS